MYLCDISASSESTGSSDSSDGSDRSDSSDSSNSSDCRDRCDLKKQFNDVFVGLNSEIILKISFILDSFVYWRLVLANALGHTYCDLHTHLHLFE